jgi:outer membrane protein
VPAAIKTGHPILSLAARIRHGDKDNRRLIERTDRLLMHEMFVGHQLKGGVVPGRGELLLPCETRVPTAPLTAQVECLHSIARLGLVDRFDRPRASGMLTADGFVLECAHEKSMRLLLLRRSHEILSHPLGGNTYPDVGTMAGVARLIATGIPPVNSPVPSTAPSLTRSRRAAILPRFVADIFFGERSPEMGVKWQGAGRRAAVVGVLVAATLGLFSTSPAAEFKMGVIDPQVVLEKSKAGKRALDGLREYVATRQKLLSRDEEELRNTEKQIKEQVSKLTDNEKKEKETSFRAKIQDYQKRAQEFNQELQGKHKELVDEYMKKIAVATQAVADKGGYQLVLDKGSEQTVKIVIFNKDTIDLTEQVIKEFDRTNK